MIISKRLRQILLLALTVAPVFAYSQGRHRLRITNLKPLNVLIGDWDLKTTMIPLTGSRTTESGTMACVSLYDSTYVECNVRLTNTNGQSRSYKQLITYNAEAAQFEVLYIYSGTPMRIVETGQIKDRTLLTSTTISPNPGKPETITSSLKVVDGDNLWFESRSTATNGEVDYTCSFSRKK